MLHLVSGLEHFNNTIVLHLLITYLIDKSIGEIQQACEEAGYVMLVTADHGNAERMIDEQGKPVTKHTTFRGIYLTSCLYLFYCICLPELCVYVCNSYFRPTM